MLKFLDVLFLYLHIVIILFNLFAWIWVKTRKIHLWVAMITLFSWLILGIKYGLGYCFLTDWHWDIKYKLGETNLPASFVKYFLDTYTSIELSTGVIDLLTALSFIVAIILSIYVNFFRFKK